MCNIMILKPGQMPDREDLDNAVYNNWHSYGLVTKIDGKLDVKRVVPESGEVDPEEVYGLLLADIEYERYLHLRYTTAGATDMTNCQPMDVYYDPTSGSQILFMHNGTFEEFKSKKVEDKKVVDDDDGPSDTKNFVDRILIPYISSMNFGTGKGDINHEMFKLFMRKFWPNGSRGLLIHSQQSPLLMGEWKKIPSASGEDSIETSNDNYFEAPIRGPEFLRREEKRRADEKEAREKRGTFRSVTPIREFDFKANHGFYSLSSAVTHIADELHLYDREGATALGYCSYDELKELYESKTDCLHVMDWVFTDYASMYDDLEITKGKLERAQRRIEELVLKAREEEKEAA